jgi:putative endonuclease
MLNKRPFSLKVFDRKRKLSRNGPEVDLRLPKVLSKGQSFIRVKPMPAWFYILCLKSGQLYIGSTTDLDRRFEEHVIGRACRTTNLDPPLKLVYLESFPDFSEACRREAQVKRWSRP